VTGRGLARHWLARRHAGLHRKASAYLRETSIVAAIGAILTSILQELWSAGYQLGQESAAQILGQEQIAADEAELDALLEQAGGRIPGMVATRVGQIENILDSAPAGVDPGELETDLEDALGSEPGALMVAQTETTWSMAEGMLGWYAQAGVTVVGWLTADDERVCAACDANESEGFIPVGEPFFSGDTQPPAHVNCRCTLMPGDIQGSPLPYDWPGAA
jgi:hypothetical protein